MLGLVFKNSFIISPSSLQKQFALNCNFPLSQNVDIDISASLTRQAPPKSLMPYFVLYDSAKAGYIGVISVCHVNEDKRSWVLASEVVCANYKLFS